MVGWNLMVCSLCFLAAGRSGGHRPLSGLSSRLNTVPLPRPDCVAWRVRPVVTVGHQGSGNITRPSDLVGVRDERGHLEAEPTRPKIPRASDVSDGPADQRDRIDLRIEITLSDLDPPEGVVVRSSAAGGLRAQPHAFVGWLGLFAVLQSLIAEPVDQPP